MDPAHITPLDERVKIIEASSDMLVLDLDDNPAGYKVGDLVSFAPDYMGTLGVMNSRYIDKVVR